MTIMGRLMTIGLKDYPVQNRINHCAMLKLAGKDGFMTHAKQQSLASGDRLSLSNRLTEKLPDRFLEKLGKWFARIGDETAERLNLDKKDLSVASDKIEKTMDFNA